MTRAILIEAPKTVREYGKIKWIEIRDLVDLQKAVGGFIEGLTFYKSGQRAWVNEDGIHLRLPYNLLATDLCAKQQAGLLPGDYIKGNMVIVGPPDDEGNNTDVSEALAAELGLSLEKQLCEKGN